MMAHFFPHIISLAPKAVSKAADALQFAGEAARGYKPIVLQDRTGIMEPGKGSERDRWFLVLMMIQHGPTLYTVSGKWCEFV